MRNFFILCFLFTYHLSQGQNSSARAAMLNNLSIVSQENQCAGDGDRALIVTQLAHVVDKYSSYFGVTEQGDLAVAYHDDGETIFEIWICDRVGLNGQAELSSSVSIDESLDCMVDEITSLDIVLGTDIGMTYNLEFGPIHIPGTDRLSSLCGYEEYYEEY